MRYSITSPHACTHTPHTHLRHSVPSPRTMLSAGFLVVCVCSRWFISNLLKCYCGNRDAPPPSPPVPQPTPPTHTHTPMHLYSCGFSLSRFAECAFYRFLSSLPSHPPLILPLFLHFAFPHPSLSLSLTCHPLVISDICYVSFQSLKVVLKERLPANTFKTTPPYCGAMQITMFVC